MITGPIMAGAVAGNAGIEAVFYLSAAVALTGGALVFMGRIPKTTDRGEGPDSGNDGPVRAVAPDQSPAASSEPMNAAAASGRRTSETATTGALALRNWR